MIDRVERFRSDPARRGIFLDFDGTLAQIVARPDLARTIGGAAPVLTALAQAYALVAVISGRPSEEVSRLLAVAQVRVFGLYGLDPPSGSPVRAGAAAFRSAVAEAERLAAAVPGAWVEDKVSTVTIHYRQAADPAEALARLEAPLARLADSAGLVLLWGKMSLELAPPDTPGKGAVILGEARRLGMTGCLFAGDDVADIPGFAALEELGSEGIDTLAVAVRSEGTPRELIDRADLVVDDPAGLVGLLSRLIPQ